MNYENMNSKWEEIFFQEALELEEKMNLLTADELNKSRIRLLLENNILTWQKYQVWFTEQLQCTSLSSNLTQAQLLNLRKQSAQTLEAYQQYDFWSEDLVPLQTWDGHLIVAGLEFNENLLLIPNLIFVLAEPFVLSFISDNLEENDNAHDFLNLEVASEKPSGPVPSPEPSSDAVWDYLTERHEEYSFEAKKLFSGYVVLKIVDFKTQVFKMDSDLGHYLKQTDVFTYDLSLDNAFRRVYETGISETFNINQLQYPIMEFKYVCITALRRADKTVGFLLGLQTKSLAETDQLLLEDLAKESA